MSGPGPGPGGRPPGMGRGRGLTPIVFPGRRFPVPGVLPEAGHEEPPPVVPPEPGHEEPQVPQPIPPVSYPMGMARGFAGRGRGVTNVFAQLQVSQPAEPSNDRPPSPIPSDAGSEHSVSSSASSVGTASTSSSGSGRGPGPSAVGAPPIGIGGRGVGRGAGRGFTFLPPASVAPVLPQIRPNVHPYMIEDDVDIESQASAPQTVQTASAQVSSSSGTDTVATDSVQAPPAVEHSLKDEDDIPAAIEIPSLPPEDDNAQKLYRGDKGKSYDRTKC